MKVIIGLGNPDGIYTKTYHNIGFVFIERVAQKLQIAFTKKKYQSLTGEGFYGSEKIVLLKPQTYMNNSGMAVCEVMRALKVKPEDIIICLDDIDLPPGKFRFREDGSAGTHNGLRSILAQTGKTNFKRVRIGIGKDEKMDLADYVLSNISDDKKPLIFAALDEAEKFLFDVILGGETHD